jgi:hypothetical protein
MLQRCQNQFGTPGKSSPAIFAFDMPKASLGSFTKAMDPGTTMPSWRSGNTHGFCVTGGHPPIASEPTPSLRLWATAPGATPARLTEHTTGGQADRSKPELSTLLGTGTFYFALTVTKTSKGLRQVPSASHANSGLTLLPSRAAAGVCHFY